MFTRKYTGVGEVVGTIRRDCDGQEFVVEELRFTPVLVVPAKQLILRSFVLQDPDGRVIDIDRGPGTDPITLHLTSWEQAFDAIRWLKANQGQTVQARTFYLSNQPITATTDLSAFRPIRKYHNEGDCLLQS